jgi:hypothetical protein
LQSRRILLAMWASVCATPSTLQRVVETRRAKVDRLTLVEAVKKWIESEYNHTFWKRMQSRGSFPHAAPNKRLERTRLERASLLSCGDESLKRSVRCFLLV